MIKHTLLIVLLFCSTFFKSFPSFGQSGIVETIYFKTNSFSIDKKYEKALNAIVKQLSSDSFGYLKVVGYADKNGSENYNDELSAKRSDVVYNYLASRAKFDTTRVYVAWLGKSEDAYDLHMPGAHKQKRCVDIWIQFYKKPK